MPLLPFFVFLEQLSQLVIDGYSRANAETLRLLLKKAETSTTELSLWTVATSVSGIAIVYFFAGDVATLMRFLANTLSWVG